MHAYLTLLSTNDYLPGVLCMARSLAETGTRYPLYVGLSPALPPGTEAVLVNAGLRPIRLPAQSALRAPQGQQRHHWSNTFDKIQLFGLVQFSKFVYIDSDMMVLAGIDELFDKPHMSAVVAGQLVNPGWVRLNSGLMVVEPKAGLPDQIGARLGTAVLEAARDGRQAIGDQDLINAYYPDWPGSVRNLDGGYNVFHCDVDAYVDSGLYHLPREPHASGGGARQIKVVHFIGPLKPWTARGVARHAKDWLLRRSGPARHDTFLRYCRLMARRLLPYPTPCPQVADARGGFTTEQRSPSARSRDG